MPGMPLDPLDSDRLRLPELLEGARSEAVAFLQSLDDRPVAWDVPRLEPLGLREEGLGAEGALAEFRRRYEPWLRRGA